MDTINTEVPTIAGTPFAGGFFVGRMLVGEDLHGLIVAPKSDGEHDESELIGSRKSVPGALSFFDGAANTAALAEAGSDLAKWARGLTIGGFSDWHLPSRDELEILYRALKPTAEENYCWSGDNPSSVPRSYAYSHDVPAQTAAEPFRDGGAEAFIGDYWSSTQFAGGEGYAWSQSFDDGLQCDVHKSSELRARAVRRLKI